MGLILAVALTYAVLLDTTRWSLSSKRPPPTQASALMTAGHAEIETGK